MVFVPPPIGYWGHGPWGLGTWGGLGVIPDLLSLSSSIADVKGGTLITLFGIAFVDPTVIELYDSLSNLVGEAKYFEANLDLRAKKVIAGFPALPVGTYGLRIITPGGDTGIIPNMITYKVFAEEGKVQRVRRRWAEVWQTGERILK